MKLPLKYPTKDMFALSLDGTWFVNAGALADVGIEVTGEEKGLFIGVPLTPAERRQLRIDLFDRSAEAAAKFASKRRRRTNPKPRRR